MLDIVLDGRDVRLTKIMLIADKILIVIRDTGRKINNYFTIWNIMIVTQKMLWEAVRRELPITTAYCMWDPGCMCEKKNSIYGFLHMNIYTLYTILIKMTTEFMNDAASL